MVLDFARGSDHLEIIIGTDDVYLTGDLLFDALDSNHNNVLDDADTYVRVGSVVQQGQARTSTTLELGELYNDLPGSRGGFGAGDVLILFGVTGLTMDDLI